MILSYETAIAWVPLNSETSDDVMSALDKGAKAYVLKGVGSRVLADIVRSVAAGGTYVSPTLSAQLLFHMSSASRLASAVQPASRPVASIAKISPTIGIKASELHAN